MTPPCNSEDTLPPAPSERGAPERSDQATSRELRRRPLRLALPADPIAPSVARQRVRDWLAAWSWPTDQLEDIVLAVSEAVSNAIEHAYLDQPPGLVDVRGGIETTPGGQHRATVIVRDHGRWRPPPIDDENRCRGIPLMHACMDTVTLTRLHNRAGTRVVLRSKAVPPGPVTAADQITTNAYRMRTRAHRPHAAPANLDNYETIPRPSRARSCNASRNRRDVSAEARQACATSIRRKTGHPGIRGSVAS